VSFKEYDGTVEFGKGGHISVINWKEGIKWYKIVSKPCFVC
jgi:hypothetical protein